MMLELSGLQIAVIGLAAFSAFAVGKWFFNKDEKIEARRKNSIAISAELKDVGLEFACPFFTDYAVGDYSGMFEEAKGILHKLKEPDERKLALAKVWAKQLEARLKDPAELAKIREALAAADKPATPATPAA